MRHGYRQHLNIDLWGNCVTVAKPIQPKLKSGTLVVVFGKTRGCEFAVVLHRYQNNDIEIMYTNDKKYPIGIYKGYEDGEHVISLDHNEPYNILNGDFFNPEDFKPLDEHDPFHDSIYLKDEDLEIEI